MILKNGTFIENHKLVSKDIEIQDGKIINIDQHIDGDEIYDLNHKFIMPGGIDLHVHFREPGFSKKETIKTGTMAAAKGGFTTVFVMPNLNPVPDSVEHLMKEIEIINKDAVIECIPYASVSVNEMDLELSNMNSLMKYTRYFTDDGKGVNNVELLKKAMKIAKDNNLIIASHAEDSIYKTKPEGEYVAVRREIELAKEIGCKYHFCHMSTKESFDAIKNAQNEGYPISCEVAPHHLFLNEEMIHGNPNFKMNPPLRSEENRLATVEALESKIAIAIASDHAPHTEEEKSKEYNMCPNGILGLETMIPLVYTKLVKTNINTLEDMQGWFVDGPAKLFEIKRNEIKIGACANLTVLDLDTPHVYTKDEILSKGKNSPYIGMTLYGMPILTLYKGNIVYKK